MFNRKLKTIWPTIHSLVSGSPLKEGDYLVYGVIKCIKESSDW